MLRNRIAWYLAKWYFLKCLIILPEILLDEVAGSSGTFVCCSLLTDCELVKYFSKRTFRFVWKRHRTASCTCYFPKDGGLTGIPLLILYKTLCMICSHGTKSDMLPRHKLHSGTSKTKACQGGLVRVALI